MPTLHQIHLAVNIHFGFKDCEIFKVSRKVEYVEPRQIFHYISVKMTKYKLVDIANYKRNMNHSTVLSSVKRVKGYLEVDSTYKEKIDGVKDILKSILECQTPEYYVECWIRSNNPELMANSMYDKIVSLLVAFKADLEFK